jgi:DEAD/DEAH box helicase domain-containing protein
MIPSVLSQQIQEGIREFLRTTFPVHSPFFAGMLDRLVERDEELFKGPYVSVKLPFAPGKSGREYFPDVPMKFPPFRHQEEAFARLASPGGRSTLIATGTGSGKTECFLYPILDHCLKNREQDGIKAILIYPMNALATDQAKRIARLIHDNPKLKGAVRAGLYVGDRKGGKGSARMTRDSLITDRDSLRLSPPDILLTNYKMLDYLMIRPADFKLWAGNEPETLKYLVVDELHTFDGAQGTDLACLIRRLKARLGTPKDYLCCVGTSATLGTGDDVGGRLVDYAAEVFGEPFGKDSIVTEHLLQPHEFFGSSLINMGYGVPGLESAHALAPDDYDSQKEYVAAQARLWFNGEVDIEERGGRVALSDRLMQHVFFRNLITVLNRRLYMLDEVVDEMSQGVHELRQGDMKYRRNLVVSMLGLISYARKLTAEDDGQSSGAQQQEAPFLNVRIQTWMRELRRLVGGVSVPPDIRFSDDLTDEQRQNHLPVVHCRECGTTGWLGTKRQQDDEINPDLQHIYECFFQLNPTTVFLFPDGQPTAEEQQAFERLLCGHCLHLTSGKEVEACPACGKTERMMPVYFHHPRIRQNDRTRSSHNCPYCHGQNSLTIMGSRAASLISVAISQLYSSIYNDDKKALAFSDSVQDAAHRAGFFGARTYRFNLRSAIQQFIKEAGDTRFDDLPARFIEYCMNRWDRNEYITIFMPPDLKWLEDYETLCKTGELPEDTNLLDLLKKRIDWELYSEYLFRCRIGRTLEKSGCSVADVNAEMVQQAVENCIEHVQNQIGGMQAVTPINLRRFTEGMLAVLKSKGAMHRSDLETYVHEFGGYYMLNKQGHLPRFGRPTRTPGFLTTRQGTGRFDVLTGRGTSRTWYEDWAKRCFAEQAPQIGEYAESLYRMLIDSLVKSDVMGVAFERDELIWGIQAGALTVTHAVSGCRCDVCGHRVSVASVKADTWEGMPCLRGKCKGQYEVQPLSPDYYGKLYSLGDVQRVIPEEHTALLDRDKRENIESRFEEKIYPWDPNLLSCTPTLEMGIDIGQLSSAILCSIPPSQASYLQRIGRTGRRDGNSFNFTVANGRPHDLYFYTEPTEMLDGDIEPPACYLSASAVLARQFTGFCFDRWVETGIPVTALPGKLGKVLANLKTNKDKDKLFPYTFIGFIDGNRGVLLSKFTALFDELPTATLERLTAFVNGTGTGGDEPDVCVRILGGLEEIQQEVESLRNRVRSLSKAIKKLEGSATKDSDAEDELDHLEREKSSLGSIAQSIVSKDTFNFFTDEGLLPNYAFPEAGILLRSVILRKKKKQDGRGKYKADTYEYERPAVSAIHELAPSNEFYAEGRKVGIDQIDMRLSEIEEWRFCNCCPHVEKVQVGGTVENACPKCGSTSWADTEQVRPMIKMRQVIATTMDRDSRIQDDRDEREPQFFNKYMLVELPAANIEKAWRISNPDLPFGFEFATDASFCEINFGNRATGGETIEIAGREVPKTGFMICSECGKVERTGPRYNHEDFSHAITCTARSGKAQPPLRDCIYLYRQFNSEAIRILLPVTSFAGAEEKLQSFIAAVVYGLKLRFHGNIDHLKTTVQEEPMLDNPSMRTQFLVLYDSVPGGTGYLKELLEDGKGMMELFKMALDGLKSCQCRLAPEKDGCYRCLYAYRSSFNMPQISRSAAMDILADLIKHAEDVVETDTITKINQHAFIESELEAYFIQALQRYRHGDKPTTLRKEVVKQRTGWFYEINGVGYYVVPQVELREKDGIPIPTRPDFVFYPEKTALTRPIAVYLDGFRHHADLEEGRRASRVGDDTAKRMGLVLSGRFWVWSLTWDDVDRQFKEEEGYRNALLQPLKNPEAENVLNALRNNFEQDSRVSKVGNVVDCTSFSLFGRFLAEPDEIAWRTNAFLLSAVAAQRFAVDEAELTKAVDALETKFGLSFFRGASCSTSGIIAGQIKRNGESEEAALSFTAWCEPTAVQKKAIDDLGLIVTLDDVSANAPVADYKKAWNEFLRLFNMMQFLPAARFVTVQGGMDAAYAGIEFQKTNVTVATAQAALEDEFKGFSEVLSADLVQALRVLNENGVSLPAIDDIPLDLLGKDGEVLAECELGWRDARMAFVYADDARSKKQFEDNGWTVYAVDQLVDDPYQFIAALKREEDSL